jgi:hypothetical protein
VFSIYTWRASISSALSILNSSSCGSTVMVTVFANMGYCASGLGCLGCYFVVSCTSVLDDGRVLTLSALARSITLWSVIFGNC